MNTNGTLNSAELREAAAYKKEEKPDNSGDVIADAMQKARDARNAQRRVESRAVTEEYNKTAIEPAKEAAGVTKPVVKTQEATENTLEDLVETDEEVTPTTQEATEDSDELDDESLKVKVSRLVNGQKVTKTVGEWLALADQVETATQEATRLRQEFNNRNKEVTAQPVLDENADPTDEELELVTAMQTGTPAEAAKALRKAQAQAAGRAQAQGDNIRQDNEAKAMYGRLRADPVNKDIVSDDNLWQLAIRKDVEYSQKEPLFRNDPQVLKKMEARFEKCLKEVRDWSNGLKGEAVNTNKRQQLVAKKKKLLSATAANNRVPNEGGDGVKTFTTEQEYNAHVANAMKNGRRKVQFN